MTFKAILALVFLAATAAALPAEAAGGLAVGTCVSVRQQPGPARIIQVTPGGYLVRAQGKRDGEALNWQQDNVTPGPCPTGEEAVRNLPSVCPASEPDGDGRSAAESAIRGALRRLFERPVQQGSDGATTVRFQAVAIGQPRAWADHDNINAQADRSRPIYDVRATYTTCADYLSAIEFVRVEQNFHCFAAPDGRARCEIAPGSGDLAPVQRQKITKQ